MNRWFGKIGFCELVEETSYKWVEKIEERDYSGEIQKLGRRLQNQSTVNDGIQITNQLSILADPYAYNHFQDMRYVVVWGVKWKVTSIDVQYPRLILTLGEEYHGQEYE